MKKHIKNLSIALLVQVLLIAFFYTRSAPTATFNATEPLLSVAMDKLDKIEIVEQKKEGDAKKDHLLTLVKKDGKWTLPEMGDFPAQESKINDLTKALDENKKNWPIAKTKIAAKKLRVVDGDFERKITFHAAGKSQTLFLGDSSGVRKVNARVDGEEPTYSIKFAASDVPTEAAKWVDKNLAKMDKSTISKIDFGTLHLTGKDGNFEVAELAPTEETEVAKVSSLVNQVALLSFDEVLGKKEEAKKGAEEFSFKVTPTSGDEITYSFFQVEHADAKDSKKEGDSDLVMVVSKYPYAFKLKASRVASLRNLKREDYVKEKGKEGAAPAAGSEAAPAQAGDEHKPISGEHSSTTPATPKAM